MTTNDQRVAELLARGVTRLRAMKTAEEDAASDVQHQCTDEDGQPKRDVDDAARVQEHKEVSR